MSNRSLKARKVILAFSIILVVTLYLGVTTISCIFGSVEDRDVTYAQKLFNEVSFFELLYVHCIYTEIIFSVKFFDAQFVVSSIISNLCS